MTRLRLVAFVLLAMGVAAPSARAAAVPDRDHDKIYDDLEQSMSSDSRLSIIVTLKAPATTERLSRIEQAVGRLDRPDPLHIVPAFAAQATPAQIRALARQTDVADVEADAKVVPFSLTAQDSFGVSQARAQIQNLDGRGEVAAVIDSGIDPTMPDLAGKIVGWKDLTANPRDTPYDDYFHHGSEVSDILAGSGDSGPEGRGVAPAAKLVGVKVIDSTGNSSLSLIAQGIQWAVDNRDTYGIDAINLSIGDPTGCGSGQDLASQAIDAAVAKGIVVVAAAGNSGPASCTVKDPGAAESALTVGAMADTGVGGFTLGWFSSRGPTQDGRTKPDISAPGVKVPAAGPGGYPAGTGTSAAAPFVTGTALLMLQANPSLTPAKIKAIVERTAIDWGAPGPDDEYGAGRLDVYAALNAAGAALAVPPAEPEHAAWTGTLAQGEVFTQGVDVTDARSPLAVTLTGPAGAFDLTLLDGTGEPVGAPVDVGFAEPSGLRQQDFSLAAPAPGHYTVKVVARTGGAFVVDASGALAPADTTAPSLTLEAPAVGAFTATATPTIGGAAGDGLGDFPGVAAYVRQGGQIVRRLGAAPALGRWSATVTPALPDGVYTVEAEQGDSAGNVTRTAARTFTIDTTPPVVTIASGPAAATAATAATFSLSLSEVDATAECRLDGGAWRPCAGSAQYAGLASGSHVFEARATDAAGTTGPAARWPWQIAQPVTPAATPTPTPAPRACRPTLVVPAQRLSSVRRHGLSLTVRASAACRVQLAVRLGTTRLGGRAVGAGPRATRVAVALKRSRLAHRKAVTLTVTAAAGARTVTKRIKLR